MINQIVARFGMPVVTDYFCTKKRFHRQPRQLLTSQNKMELWVLMRASFVRFKSTKEYQKLATVLGSR